MKSTRSTSYRTSRQLELGDVDSDRLITASGPPYHYRTLAQEDYAKSLREILPFSTRAGGRIRLPIRDQIDPSGEFGWLFSGSCPNKRRRRNIIIGSLIAAWLLIVVVYVVNVNRSWLALEHKWMMETTDAVGTNITKLWGHSHNDEMHGKEAFNLALALGFGSIEVDTWLVDQHGSKSLLAGHIPIDLKQHRTIQSLYLDPMFAILESRNKGRLPNETWVGFLDDDPSAEVQLVIDFKSDGPAMWPYVLDAVQPFLEAGYLTTFNTTSASFTRGPLTIIGTGNTPLSHVYYSSTRVIFYDAPLRKLHKAAHVPASPYGPAIHIDLDNTISPMASGKIPPWTHIGTAFYPSPNAAAKWMKRRTDEARRRGIKSRWWGAAGQPGWLRRRMWALQKEARTDWINGDDLVDLAHWLRRPSSIR